MALETAVLSSDKILTLTNFWEGNRSAIRGRQEVPRPPPPPRPLDRKYAEATLEPAELQNLVDGLSERLKAGAGVALHFVLRILVDEKSASPVHIAGISELRGIHLTPAD